MLHKLPNPFPHVDAYDAAFKKHRDKRRHGSKRTVAPYATLIQNEQVITAYLVVALKSQCTVVCVFICESFISVGYIWNVN